MVSNAYLGATMKAAPIIVRTATAVPGHSATQDQVKERLRGLLALPARKLDAVMELFDYTAVERRFSVEPLSELGKPRGLGEVQRLYRDNAIALGKKVAAEALAGAGVPARDIDLIVTTSCTGIDDPLARRLSLQRTGVPRRCAPAADHGARLFGRRRGAGAGARFPGWVPRGARAGGGRRAAQPQHPARRSLAGQSGVDRALRRRRGGGGPRRRPLRRGPAGRNRGARPRDAGAPVSDLGVCAGLRSAGRRVSFRALQGRPGPHQERDRPSRADAGSAARADQRQALLLRAPPGRTKILAFIEEELGLRRDDTELSWEVLRDFGNQSSASVLFVLHEWLTKRHPPTDAYGILAAFGPGLSTEMLLLQWS